MPDIVDLTPLANLTQLERLNVRDNQIVDVSPLANLLQLQGLWINHNQIVDHSPLQALSLTEFEYDQPCVLLGPNPNSFVRSTTYQK